MNHINDGIQNFLLNLENQLLLIVKDPDVAIMYMPIDIMNMGRNTQDRLLDEFHSLNNTHD